MANVLLVCEYPTLSGGERSMLATLEGISAAGMRPIVAAPGHGPLAHAIREKGIEHLPWDSCAGPGPRPSQTALREMLARLVGHLRPDLIHANSLSMGRLTGPVAASLAVPAIAHLRDILRLSARAVADLNQHARLLAVSEATRRFHAAGGLDPAKLHVLYNGVDLQQFRPRPPSGFLHRELGLPEGVLLAGSIGQIGPRKGQDILAQAALILADELPSLHWILVGQRQSGKPESRQFENALYRLAHKLAGRFHFLGSRDDVPLLLNELDVLVHPARQEPLGRVLLEAAASGVAVVATQAGGTAEIFPAGSGAAMLVQPGDAQALAQAVRTILTDPAQRSRMAAAARRRAQQAFDIRQTVVRLVEHYQAVLAR
ncbi:MAG: glycosyltransferase family 4 protein [Thermoguttaceae bacterium]